MPYDYEAQVARLTANPSQIYQEWLGGLGLFQFATPDGSAHWPRAGCLTMIRTFFYEVPGRRDLTEAIQNDERLPAATLGEISVSDLPVFLDWQQHLDRELRRS